MKNNEENAYKNFNWKLALNTHSVMKMSIFKIMENHCLV